MYLSTLRIVHTALVALMLSLPSGAQEPPTLVANSAAVFAVNPAGEATYAVPIAAPPATAGIAPVLSLTYRSQRGVSAAGQGWGIEGLSAITRCPRTLAQDDEIRQVRYDALDRFCLNGQRLVLRSGNYGEDGASYRTEIDDYRRITGYADDGRETGRFTVEVPDGSVLEYGFSPDSRVEVAGIPDGPVRVWALTRRCDRYSNCIEYAYAEDNGTGEHRLTEVRYVVNERQSLPARYRVRFSWQRRPVSDEWEFWLAGHRITVGHRLAAVHVENFDGSQWVPVREHRLQYEEADELASGRSRLSWLQEGAAQSEWLAPLRFEWQPSAPRLQRYEFAGGEDDVASTRVGDFDNDGQQDLYIAGSSGTWVVLRTLPGADAFERITTDVPVTDVDATFLLEFDGDGRADLIMPDPATGQWRVHLSNGEAGFVDAIDTGLAIEGSPENTRVADFTGDGLADLLYLSGAQSQALLLAVNTGAAFAPPVVAYDALVLAAESDRDVVLRDARLVDFDGDGRQDLIGQLPVLPEAPQWLVAPGCRETAFDLAWTRAGAASWRLEQRRDFGAWEAVPGAGELPEPEFRFVAAGGSFYDFRVTGRNAAGQQGPVSPVLSVNIEPACDGPPVAPLQHESDTPADWVVARSGGTTFQSVLVLQGIAAPLPLDLNGDGLTDLAYLRGERLVTRLSTGTAFTPEVDNEIGATSLDSLFITDRNRDGRDDLMYARIGGESLELWALLSDGGGFEAPRLVSVSPLAGFTGSLRDPGRVRSLDLTGDGETDLAVRFSGFNQWQLFVDTSERNDLLTRITDSFGNYRAIAYQPVARLDGYVASGAPTPAQRDYAGAMPVVTRVLANDGATVGEGEYARTYTYAYGRVDMRGRGFVGFASRAIDDSRALPRSAYEYEQDFPLTGRLRRLLISTPSAGTIADVTTRWQGMPLDDHPSGRETWYVWPEEVQFDRYAVSQSEVHDGELLFSRRRLVREQDIAFDSFGQIRRVETVTTSADGSEVFSRKLKMSYHTSKEGGSYCVLPASRELLRGDATNLPGERRVSQYPRPDLVHCSTMARVDNPQGAAGEVRSTALQRDRWGNVAEISVVGEPGTARTLQLTYDDAGQFPLRLLRDPDGAALEEQLTWRDDLGGLVSLRAHGLPSLEKRWTYDALGRPLSAVGPGGHGWETSYDWCTGAGGCAPSPASVLVSTRSTDGLESRTVLDRLGRPLGTWDNAAGNPADMPGYAVVYDARGFITTASAAPAPWATGAFSFATDVQYDVLGRPLTVAMPANDLGDTAHWHYRYEGLTTEWRDARGATWQREYDILGRVIRVAEPVAEDGSLDPAKGNTWYGYTQFDELRTVRNNGLGTMMTFAYNPLGYRQTMSDVSAGEWRYTHNVFGELETRFSPAYGNTPTQWRYDSVGRLVRRSEPEGTTTWRYYDSFDSARGRLREVEYPVAIAGYGPSRVETWRYDGAARPEAWRMYEGADLLAEIDLAYDAAGRLTRLTCPATPAGERPALDYAYDERSRVERVSHAEDAAQAYYSRSTAHSIDMFGQVSDYSLGNGVTQRTVSDAATGRVVSMRDASRNGDVVQEFTWQYDALGNVIRRHDERFQVIDAASYDYRNRLQAVRVRYGLNGGGEYTDGLALLSSGSIDAKRGIGSYTYPVVQTRTGAVKSHQLITLLRDDATSESFAYTANGNLATVQEDGRQRAAYRWASYDLPTRLTAASGTVELAYGSERQPAIVDRHDRSGQRHTSERFGGIAERISTPDGIESRCYVIVEGRRIAQLIDGVDGPKTQYFHHDATGSVTALTDAAGEVVKHYRYDAFGKRRRATGERDAGDYLLGKLPGATHYGYGGHDQLDMVGLVHMGGRVYDPMRSRMLSRDPVARDAWHPQSLHGYAYTENNPLTLVDRDGLMASDEAPDAPVQMRSRWPMWWFNEVPDVQRYFAVRTDGISLSPIAAGTASGALRNDTASIGRMWIGQAEVAAGGMGMAEPSQGRTVATVDVAMSALGGALTRLGLSADSAALTRGVADRLAYGMSGRSRRRFLDALFTGTLSGQDVINARLERVRTLADVAGAFRSAKLQGPIAQQLGRIGGGLAIGSLFVAGYEVATEQAGYSKIVLIGGIAAGSALGGPVLASAAAVLAIGIGVAELSTDFSTSAISLEVDAAVREVLLPGGSERSATP